MQIQTAIRGKEAAIEMTIEHSDVDGYQVSCPHQMVVATKGITKFRAAFDTSLCASCPLLKQCKLTTDRSKKHRRYYFSEKDYQRNKRARNINLIPYERRTLRSNVEATVSEFKRKIPGGKLKVRGLFKTTLFAIASGIGINLGRIIRYMDRVASEDICRAAA